VPSPEAKKAVREAGQKKRAVKEGKSTPQALVPLVPQEIPLAETGEVEPAALEPTPEEIEAKRVRRSEASKKGAQTKRRKKLAEEFAKRKAKEEAERQPPPDSKLAEGAISDTATSKKAVAGEAGPEYVGDHQGHGKVLHKPTVIDVGGDSGNEVVMPLDNDGKPKKDIDELPHLASGFSNAAKSVAQAVGGAAKGVAQVVVDAGVGTVIGASVGNAVGRAIGGLAGATGRSVGGVAGGAVGAVGGAAVGTAVGAVRGTVSAVSGAAKGTASAANSLSPDASVIAALVGTFELLKKSVNSVIDSIEGIVTASKSWVEALAPNTIDNFNQAIRDLQATLGYAFQPIFTIMADTFRQVAGIILPLMEALRPVIESLTNTISESLINVIKVFATILTALAPLFKTWADAFGNIMNTVIKSFILLVAYIAKLLGQDKVVADIIKTLEEKPKAGLKAAATDVTTKNFETIARDMAIASANAAGAGKKEDEPKKLEDVISALKDIMKGDEAAIAAWSPLFRDIKAGVDTLVSIAKGAGAVYDKTTSGTAYGLATVAEYLPTWLGGVPVGTSKNIR
jgi:hypothetical protein